MITITGTPFRDSYKIRIDVRSQKEQEICEIYAFIRFMLSHDPEMLNVVLDELMPDISESTYNMDPKRWAAYKMVLEDME